jgi:hypothetical protein
MVSMLVKLVLVVAAAAGLSLVAAPQATASTYEWNDLLRGAKVTVGERVVINVCWRTSARIELFSEDSDGLHLIDSVRGVKSIGTCGRRSPYLQRHVWTVSKEPTRDDSGRSVQELRLGSPAFWLTKVEVLSSTPAPQPTPTVEPTPSSVPAPVATPTQVSPAATPVATTPSQFNNAFASTLWNAAQRAPDRQYGRCLTLANPKYDVDSREFYKLGAWSGQQLHNLSYSDALTTVWFAYQVYCDGTFGIKTRW